MKYAFLAMMLFAAASPAAADQVRFTGRTSATDPILIRDALQNILRYAHATQQCTTLSSVEASVLPADYRPADPRYRVADGPVTYERWDAVLCGRSTPFLVGFWPAPEGGTMFQVSHPIPDDLPEVRR